MAQPVRQTNAIKMVRYRETVLNIMETDNVTTERKEKVRRKSTLYFAFLLLSLSFFGIPVSECQAQLPWGKTFYATGYNQKFTKEGQDGRLLTQALFTKPTCNTVTFEKNIITIKLDGFIVDMLKVTDMEETDNGTTGLCVSLKYKFEYTYCLFHTGKRHNVNFYNFDLYTPVILDRYQLVDDLEAAKELE